MANAQNRWNPFEHALYRSFQENSLSGKKLVLMVSGGADSMAMLASVLAIRSGLNLELLVLHCHHGETQDLKQNEFRNQAESFVQDFCRERDLRFETVRRVGVDQASEMELRKFRKQAAGEIMQKYAMDFSLWAHHRDDFLETQMLKLIRGTGPQSLFEPMRFQRGQEIRPFLQASKVEILAYLRDKNIRWIDDPSNENQDYLRNWLRKNWLPQLEEKCPGALASFSRSLGLLQESNELTIPPEIWTENGVDRAVYLTLNEAQKKQALALYLRRCGKLEFSQNQIFEVMRHLDKSLFDHTFKAAQVTWSITRHLIQVVQFDLLSN